MDKTKSAQNERKKKYAQKTGYKAIKKWHAMNAKRVPFDVYLNTDADIIKN